MSIFTPEGSKPRYTREEDKLLLQLVKKGERVWNISSRLMRSEASVKGRLRFLKYCSSQYGKNAAKALEKYRLRNGKLYVSLSKWTEEADRDLIKKYNAGKCRFDKRASRRLSVLKKKWNKLQPIHNVATKMSVSDLLRFTHQKAVPAKQYLAVIKECERLLKFENEVTLQKIAISELVSKLAA